MIFENHLFKVVVLKIRSLKKENFPMILRLEIIRLIIFVLALGQFLNDKVFNSS